MSQNAQVLKHMRERGSLTTLLAFTRYGVTRLSARILELEKDGHLFNDCWVTRNGKRFKSWSLVEGKRRAA